MLVPMTSTPLDHLNSSNLSFNRFKKIISDADSNKLTESLSSHELTAIPSHGRDLIQELWDRLPFQISARQRFNQ